MVTKPLFINIVKQYGKDIGNKYFDDFPVEEVNWEISTRAKRRAGVTKYNRDTGEITISITWAAHEKLGWEDTAETVRHEIIHAFHYWRDGNAGHGRKFKRLADKLDTPQHCKRFTEPNYWIICEGCGKRDARYKRSKTVKHPEKYRCGSCGGKLRSEEA